MADRCHAGAVVRHRHHCIVGEIPAELGSLASLILVVATVSPSLSFDTVWVSSNTTSQ